jgi:hypothetical protein
LKLNFGVSFSRLIALPSPGLNFLKSCIAIEAGLVSEGNTDALRQLRKLFNLAVELYGHYDEGLWLEYCAQERKVIFLWQTRIHVFSCFSMIYFLNVFLNILLYPSSSP